jgi:trk system potassium uptake protein TrkH
MRSWIPIQTYRSLGRVRRTGLLRASPPAVLAGGFIVLILVGTALLSLPIASREPISLLSAYFMATSAVTVTGLTVVDPAQALTHFGQIVLITLVQLGGLGFVTLAVVAAIKLGKKMSLSHQALALEAFNQTSVSKIHRTALSVFKISIAIEAMAALILALWWWRDHDLPAAIGLAAFHAVAAFNNAGFSLFESSLTSFVDDPVVILTITFSIILGGIGFSVLGDAAQKRRWSSLMPYTKLILISTLLLNLFGFFAIWALEFKNPGTLGSLSFHGQALAAWLQSVTSRTAGFVGIDLSQLRDTTTLLIIFLMFIGGGSLSTASGIKIGTFVVLLAAVHSYIFQRKEAVLFRRAISPDTVQKALALLLVTGALAFLGTLALTLFEDLPFLDLLFEVVSALSTTGQTRNLTHQLSAPSQILLTFLMFAGRLGPLTLVYSLSSQKRSRIRFPEAQFQVG